MWASHGFAIAFKKVDLRQSKGKWKKKLLDRGFDYLFRQFLDVFSLCTVYVPFLALTWSISLNIITLKLLCIASNEQGLALGRNSKRNPFTAGSHQPKKESTKNSISPLDCQRRSWSFHLFWLTVLIMILLLENNKKKKTNRFPRTNHNELSLERSPMPIKALSWTVTGCN